MTVSGETATLQFRSAGPDDAEAVALLHADSWRRHYRGAYSDEFLDGDVVEHRRAAWSARLAVADGGAETVLAERDGRLVGFVHVVFDDDARWGSLVDNLHVVHDHKGAGIGTQLLRRAAEAVGARASGPAVYLWVLQQNTAAQGFYLARGATCVEEVPLTRDPEWLNGTPTKLRMAWPDAGSLR
jgi:ribosomal protein S18 acetylase RimI-like enzyme